MTGAHHASPGFPIRLLVLDIDGTLVGEDMVVRDRTAEAVRAAVRRGVAVSLATGRMASSAQLFADLLGLADPIVAYQGAVIRAMPDARQPPRRDGRPRVGRLLRHTPLAADVARDAIRWCGTHGLDPHLNHLERFIVRFDDPRAHDYSTFLGARAEPVPDLLAAIQHPVTKVIARGEIGLPEAVLGDARAEFAGRAEVTLSHPRFIEFVAPGVSKGRAIRWLARHAGVPLSQTLAVGDQWNDLEMIAAAGHGAAMPSAPAPVRLEARYVAPPLEAEGAAQLIEELVLAGPRAAAVNARRRMEAGRASRSDARRELQTRAATGPAAVRSGVARPAGVGG